MVYLWRLRGKLMELILGKWNDWKTINSNPKSMWSNLRTMKLTWNRFDSLYFVCIANSIASTVRFLSTWFWFHFCIHTLISAIKITRIYWIGLVCCTWECNQFDSSKYVTIDAGSTHFHRLNSLLHSTVFKCQQIFVQIFFASISFEALSFIFNNKNSSFSTSDACILLILFHQTFGIAFGSTEDTEMEGGAVHRLVFHLPIKIYTFRRISSIFRLFQRRLYVDGQFRFLSISRWEKKKPAKQTNE